MSKKPRKTSGGSRAQFYASRRGAIEDQQNGNKFTAALILLSLGAFAAVYLWNGPPPSFSMNWQQPDTSEAQLHHLYTASEAELARERWPESARALDRAQPVFSSCPKRPPAPVQSDAENADQVSAEAAPPPQPTRASAC